MSADHTHLPAPAGTRPEPSATNAQSSAGRSTATSHRCHRCPPSHTPPKARSPFPKPPQSTAITPLRPAPAAPITAAPAAAGLTTASLVPGIEPGSMLRPGPAGPAGRCDRQPGAAGQLPATASADAPGVLQIRTPAAVRPACQPENRPQRPDRAVLKTGPRKAKPLKVCFRGRGAAGQDIHCRDGCAEQGCTGRCGRLHTGSRVAGRA